METLKQKREALIKELKKERNDNTYKIRLENKMICADCCLAVDKYYFSKHLETKSHIKIVNRPKKEIKEIQSNLKKTQ